MRLPDSLQYRSYTEWNYVVRGLMEVWELARLVGMERHLEEQVALDEEGRLVDLLGRIGNDCASLAATVRLHHQAAVLRERLASGDDSAMGSRIHPQCFAGAALEPASRMS